MSTIHIANEKGRDATVGLVTVKASPRPKLGVPGKRVVFRRYLSTTEEGTHEALTARFGGDYAQALIDGDPEVDLEVVGLTIDHTQMVYLDGDESLMFVEPTFLEVVLAVDGSEKERRTPVNSVSNVNSELPIRWSGRKIPISEAVRKFSFKRSMQLQHTDGLTYDFLYAMAKDLEVAGSLMLIGSGDKGLAPLVFQSNGRPYRGFLRGQTNGKAYRLTLHLSDLELKKPFIPDRGATRE
jgi:hypothetical protein